MSKPDETGPIENEEQIPFNEEEQEIPFNEEEQEIPFNEEEQEIPFDEEEQSADFVSFKVSESLDHDDDDMNPTLILNNINLCKAFFIGFQFELVRANTILFKIPTSILPLSVSVVNGFHDSPYLIECKIELSSKNPYSSRPYFFKITNPTYDETFPGSILIKNRYSNFFSPTYKPSANYRCQNYVLAPQVTADSEKIASTIETLVYEGFTEKQAKKALLFCSYDVNKARDYLISGLLPQTNFPIPLKYSDCPLFYLILELCEAFFDMGDCCCVCGKKLGVYHLKPACCDKEQCQYSFLNLGVGTNIIGEIKRDPLATDFLIVLAGAACIAPQNPPVFEPSPNSSGIKFSKTFFEKLPSMKNICNRCNTDRDLKELIGENNYEILRFFILANKAQLITLPEKVQVQIGSNSKQFLITSVSPESELIFRSKRELHGVKWLWHGSRAERWYRILHTGLKDFGNTIYQLHAGPIYGDGIYMSDSFLYSYGYCVMAENIYKKSNLPKRIIVISLVENANVPELVGPVAYQEYTQRDDSACITRVLFCYDASPGNNNNLIDYNALKNPPKVPTLSEVLSHQMEKYH